VQVGSDRRFSALAYRGPEVLCSLSGVTVRAGRSWQALLVSPSQQISVQAVYPAAAS